MFLAWLRPPIRARGRGARGRGGESDESRNLVSPSPTRPLSHSPARPLAPIIRRRMPRVIEGEPYGQGLRFAVIASRFHEKISERLLAGAIECLERHGVPTDSIEVFRVPGAFEIPSLAAELSKRGNYDALVTVGVLIRGDTPHFDFICAQATEGISRVSVETGLPISFGVITCNTAEQAEERTRRGNNKGWEAALAALELASLYSKIRTGRGGEGARGRRGERSNSKSSRESVAPSPRRPLTPSRRKGGR